MKQVVRLQLGADEIQSSDINLAIELNACGRGFITASTTQNYTGKLVRLDVGYPDSLLRWFTGYVERSQAADNGTVRLFVREAAGIFERHWPCSFQHPTLRQITDWLAGLSGLRFVLPEGASYTDNPAPYFTHSGSGYQLLAQLGPAFGIPDYIWCPMPDGSIYLGEAGKFMLARPIAMPPEFSQQVSAGKSMTVPVVQGLRPGVIMNGHRITHIRLHNQVMDLTWTPQDSSGNPLQKSPAQQQIERLYPELSSGLHLPKFARVQDVAENATAGSVADPYRPRYAVDLQLLDADGKPVKNTPVYPAVPLPVPMAGNDSGVFSYPPAGSMVEIGFTDGRPDKPFIRQTLAQGNSLPDVKPGEQLQQQRAEVSQRVSVAGDWIRQTDQAIVESSMSRSITADTETREVVTRTTTIKASDTTTVVGSAVLMAGAIQQITTGDYSVGARNVITSISGDLKEKIAGLRQAVASARQEYKSPETWLGSESVNVLALLIETLDTVATLASQVADHTHPDTGKPENAADIKAAATTATQLKDKYQPLIAT